MVANEKEVVAIVATYNEGERLRPVLESLSKCELILDIVVVDDGSKDPPLWASDFPKVRLFRHDKNVGKGAAMETGVRATDATYIFFCDADLVGFLPEHAVAIIKPVISGEYRTFLGLRENKEQQAVLLFALNSGERCLYRSDWETLPRFYKKERREIRVCFVALSTDAKGKEIWHEGRHKGKVAHDIRSWHSLP